MPRRQRFLFHHEEHRSVGILLVEGSPSDALSEQETLRGGKVLAEIKQDEHLKHIPIIALTTSQTGKDVLNSYASNANCYISKPVNLDQFINLVKSIEDFWLTIVRLPKVA